MKPRDFIFAFAAGFLLSEVLRVTPLGSAVLQYSKNHTDTDTDNKKNKRKVSKKPKKH